MRLTRLAAALALVGSIGGHPVSGEVLFPERWAYMLTYGGCDPIHAVLFSDSYPDQVQLLGENLLGSGQGTISGMRLDMGTGELDAYFSQYISWGRCAGTGAVDAEGRVWVIGFQQGGVAGSSLRLLRINDPGTGIDYAQTLPIEGGQQGVYPTSNLFALLHENDPGWVTLLGSIDNDWGSEIFADCFFLNLDLNDLPFTVDPYFAGYVNLHMQMSDAVRLPSGWTYSSYKHRDPTGGGPQSWLHRREPDGHLDWRRNASSVRKHNGLCLVNSGPDSGVMLVGELMMDMGGYIIHYDNQGEALWVQSLDYPLFDVCRTLTGEYVAVGDGIVVVFDVEGNLSQTTIDDSWDGLLGSISLEDGGFLFHGLTSNGSPFVKRIASHEVQLSPDTLDLPSMGGAVDVTVVLRTELIQTDVGVLTASLVHHGQGVEIFNEEQEFIAQPRDVQNIEIQGWLDATDPTGVYDLNVLLSSRNGMVATTVQGVVTKQTSRVEAETLIPSTRIALSPVYPNPFNASARLDMALPSVTHVAVTLHDILGRQVAVVHNGELENGVHTVTMNGETLAAGSYLVRITAGSESFSRRITLLK